MKKSLVLAMAMALGVSATAFAANPFSDVPAGHWAYASVAKLAAAGIVDGYPDGTFKGDQLMTRYEMAQIVAKAYAKGAIGADDKVKIRGPFTYYLLSSVLFLPFNPVASVLFC